MIRNEVYGLTLIRFFGDGLFTLLDYDSWKLRRRLHDPAFNKMYGLLLQPHTVANY